jgi:hemoglobin-like flavoprotein
MTMLYECDALLNRWERLQPYADRFATAFFDTLFEADPELGQLFSNASLETQFTRFAHLLTKIVSATDDDEELNRRIESTVRRFTRGGSDTVRSRAVRAAIAAMLVQVALTAMTPQMLAPWKAAYTTVTEMLRGTARLGGRAAMERRVRAELARERRSAA